MVGAAGFEPATPGPPDRCANRAAPRSDFRLTFHVQILARMCNVDFLENISRLSGLCVENSVAQYSARSQQTAPNQAKQ